MTDERRTHLAKLMTELIQQLDAEVATLKAQNKPIAPDRAIGRLSRLEAMNDKSIREATIRKLETRLDQIHQAMARVNEPDFGVCKECEEEISQKRLELLPESQLCMNCLRAR